MDWSDLEEKIDYVLSDYDNIRNRLVYNFRKSFIKHIKMLQNQNLDSYIFTTY